MTNSYKTAVAQHFSAAAPRYDLVAHLQRKVCQQLLSYLPTHLQPQHCVDLGAGTGYASKLLRQRFKSTQITAVDMALGMLQHMQKHQLAEQYLCADMEALPLAPLSTDLIFSSLAMQWSLDLKTALQQCLDCLRPNGYLVFSTVLEGSLFEFKNSWAQVDNLLHINTFRTTSQYRALCTNSGFNLVLMQPHTHRYFYSQLNHLRHELRDLGANYVHAKRQAHLAARQRWHTLQQAYEQYRTPQGLPATWHIFYVVLQKPA